MEETTQHDYSTDHIQFLLCIVAGCEMLYPAAFKNETVEELQRVYNGIGPERWSSKFRALTTKALSMLEAPALIHDWEFTHQPKTYKCFTMANVRLCINSWKDKRFKEGLIAAVLCQLFGWSGYKSAS